MVRSVLAALLVMAFVLLFAVLARFGLEDARAQQSAGASAAAGAALGCKLHAGGRCCDPAVTQHLPREAIFAACGQSDATFAGEVAGPRSCRYVFRIPGHPESETFVQVETPPRPAGMTAPGDLGSSWKKLGPAFVTDSARAHKAGASPDLRTGLWLAGSGYQVKVEASTRVCARAVTARLASSLR